MIKHLISIAQEELNYFFKELNVEKADAVLKELLSCQGKIIFTGVGKSGIIAEKIAKTMASTGTKSISLSALDALHGDIAMVEPKDLFIAISKSGNTEELKKVLPAIKARKTKTMGWFCNSAAQLTPFCDLVMVLPIQKELCPFDLAPTISTQVQLIFGDLMAVGLMRQKSFSMQEYSLNHPAGSIGKAVSLKVEDLMLKGDKIPTCSKENRICDVLVELTSKRCGSILIVDKENCVEGIFTDGDLRRAMQLHSGAIFDLKIGEIMTKEFLHIEQEAMAREALSLMQNHREKRVTMLPVLSQKKLKGIILMHDIVNAGIV
jgi:arabinose-5-phosphate isomerase